MIKDFNIETYNSIDSREYYDLREEAEKKFPNDKKKRLEYAKEIMPGQIYMDYLIDIFQRATIECAYPSNDKERIKKVEFTTASVETLLRAMSFMIERMHDGLPEHNYDYIKTKSSTFFNQLYKQVGERLE